MKLSSTISPAWWGLAFIGYALASLAWAASINQGALANLGLWVVAFLVGLYARSLYWVYVALTVILAVNVGVASMQWLDLGFQRYMIQNPAGLFGNSNYLACVLAVGLAAALAERLYWFLSIGALGLWLTSSRTAIAASGIALLTWLWPRSKYAVMTVAPLTIVAVIAVTGTRADSISPRLGVWQDALNHLTFFGSGFGTFQAAYDSFAFRTNMTEFRAAHAYNDYLELVFELGIGTILLWILLGFALERAIETERLVLIAFLVLALTYFPLQIVGPLVAMALGHSLAERKSYGTLALDKRTLSEHH